MFQTVFRNLILGLATTVISLSSALADGKTCTALHFNGAKDWFPVFNRLADGNTVSGIMPTILTRIADEHGWAIQIDRSKPWRRLFMEAERGELDVIAGVYYKKDRAAKYRLIGPVFQDDAVIFVPANRQFAFSHLSDLKNKVGMRISGGSFGDDFDAYAEAELDIAKIPSEKQDILMNLLVSGRADYLVLGYLDGQADITRLGLTGRVVALPKRIASNPVYFLFSKTSACRDRAGLFEASLNKMRRSGEIDKIIYAALPGMGQ